MDILTPAQVNSNRTARLAATRPRPRYTTETKPVVREHLTVVEWDGDFGRYWSAPMPDSEVDFYISHQVALGYVELSDIDHAAKCWCFQ